jgi:hypothetical protein
MRSVVRLLCWSTVTVAWILPTYTAGFVRAAASPVSLSMSAITVPGISPLASFVNHTGTQEIIAGVNTQTGLSVFLLYDLKTRRLLRSTPVPAMVRNAKRGNQALDLQRNLGYV